MKNSVELLDEKTQLKNRAAEIIANAKREIRMLNTEENNEIADIKGKILTINEELRQLDVDLPQEINNQINKTNITMEKNFSLLTAIRNVANNKPQDELT